MAQKNKNIVKAINKNVRSSPRKVNLLLKNIRGKKADIAIRDLSFVRQRIAFDIKKTVQAAIANAENNVVSDFIVFYQKFSIFIFFCKPNRVPSSSNSQP